MSTTYSFTRNIYTQIPSWPGYIVMPSDGDPFIAQSAQIFEKGLQDRNMFILESAIKAPMSSSQIKAYSLGGSTVYLEPFIIEALNLSTYRIIEYSTQTTITPANLDPPAAVFAGNTWYYVYLQLNNDNSTQIIVSTSAPHVYLLYADVAGVQDKTLKYLFSFFTNGLGLVTPFNKQGQIVMYKSMGTIQSNGAASVFTAISLTNVKPPHAKMIYLGVDLYNADTAAEAILQLGDGTASATYDIYSAAEPLYPDLFYSHTRWFWMPCNPTSNNIFYKIVSGSPNTRAWVYLGGYVE